MARAADPSQGDLANGAELIISRPRGDASLAPTWCHGMPDVGDGEQAAPRSSGPPVPARAGRAENTNPGNVNAPPGYRGGA